MTRTRRYRPAHRRIPAFLALAFLWPTAGQAGDPARGRDLAARWCTACHVVADDIPGGTVGPAFSAVPTLHGRTRKQVIGWLAAPHKPMPDFGLSAREIEDLAVYIDTLDTGAASAPTKR